MTDEARRAYLAGIIDEDGHVSWRAGKYQTPVLGVTNTSEELLQWLTREVGGSVAVQRGLCPADCASVEQGHRHRRKIVFRWQTTGERACIVMRAIRPYMVIKGDRIDSVLQAEADVFRQMQRPKRREYHRAKERLAMSTRGWD